MVGLEEILEILSNLGDSMILPSVPSEKTAPSLFPASRTYEIRPYSGKTTNESVVHTYACLYFTGLLQITAEEELLER